MVSFLFFWEVIITTLTVINGLMLDFLLRLGVVSSPLVLRLAPSVTRLGWDPKINEGIPD
jgi:hypothetical protein